MVVTPTDVSKVDMIIDVMKSIDSKGNNVIQLRKFFFEIGGVIGGHGLDLLLETKETYPGNWPLHLTLEVVWAGDFHIQLRIGKDSWGFGAQGHCIAAAILSQEYQQKPHERPRYRIPKGFNSKPNSIKYSSACYGPGVCLARVLNPYKAYPAYKCHKVLLLRGIFLLPDFSRYMPKVIFLFCRANN